MSREVENTKGVRLSKVDGDDARERDKLHAAQIAATSLVRHHLTCDTEGKALSRAFTVRTRRAISALKLPTSPPASAIHSQNQCQPIAMGSHYAFDHISKGDFENALSQYDGVVPSKLAELEEQRLHIIPKSLATRKKGGRAYLTKQEVATLVDWKLYVHAMPTDYTPLNLTSTRAHILPLPIPTPSP